VNVAVVVPCYNEEPALPRLAERLAICVERASADDVYSFVFVDDGSTDGTRAGLEALAARFPGSRCVAHERNAGLGAALRTGIAAAEGDAVVTIDSDCTYDPAEVPELVALLADADMVLGSPYHPAGRTENVIPYRLALSKTLSAIYRVLLRTDIHTFTSLFRAHRAEVAKSLHSQADDYVALTEMLVDALRSGYRIVEYPTVLHVRVAGASKLKVVRTMARHGRMILRLATGRRAR
jgi:dolichol-phosphate mannosyltransferase